MSREIVWLFGRGLSIECGLSWGEPNCWRSLPRDERITRIKKQLRVEMDAPGVNTRTIKKFLDGLVAQKCQNLLVTTNWDYLVQREIDAYSQDSLHPTIRSGYVFHVNGSIEDLPANPEYPSRLPGRSCFALEDDPPEIRAPSVELNEALDAMYWRPEFVVVGMSFECGPDRFLLHLLGEVRDHLPCGESHWFVVNPCGPVLQRVCSEIQKALPESTVTPVPSRFGNWQDKGYPELKAAGVFCGDNDTQAT